MDLTFGLSRIASSTFGTQTQPAASVAALSDPPSRTQSITSGSTAREVNDTASENSEFLVPINFDDFHNSIASGPSLNHFPLPGHGGAGYEAKTTASKPTNRWTTAPSIQSAKEPRSAGMVRRLSNANRPGQATAGSKAVAPAVPSVGRARRQSYVPPVPTSVVVPRRPRKSIGPGSLVSDHGDSHIPARSSFIRKRTIDESRLSSNVGSMHDTSSSTFQSAVFSASRSQKARSLQPPGRNMRENLSTTTDHSRSASNNILRTPQKATGTKVTTPSSSKRVSIMPPHATGLGARTISPTDARRMKRVSLIPHPPPLPGNSPTNLDPGNPRPRSSVQSPSAIPRKSVTPSSTRTTPDPHRKSYSSGMSLSSSTSYNSARNSSGSLQARLSQNISSSRLPTPKPRMDGNNRSTEDDVPPVPAIPKAYESPKNEQHMSFITPRKSSMPLEVPSLAETSKLDSDSSSGPPSETIHVPKKVFDETPIKETKSRPPVNLSKKNLQPLKLPPLNLLPLSVPINNKIEALRERASQDTTPHFTATPPRRTAAKTPSTPLTASKATFFNAFPATDQTRSTTSHFLLRTDFTKFRVDNSSSAFDVLEMPSTRNISPYISTSFSRNGDEPGFIRPQPSDAFLRGTPRKPTGPRPQTQISTFSNADMFSFGLTPDAETEISFPPPSPRRNEARANSKMQSISDSAKDPVKVDSMPPPKLPASATWSSISASRVSPTSKKTQLQSKRSTSISNLASIPSPRRNQSISSDHGIAAKSNSPADSGDATTSTNRTSSSILSPVHKFLNGSRSSPTPKSNAERDDLAAEEEMRKLGSKRKDFEVAAKELEDLRRRASPKERASPAQALKVANLNIFERGEIIDFKHIYFCGTHKAKKLVGDLNASSANFGYDDERGDYNIVIGDHLAYRYEIVDVLGKGSFGQVVRCVDHKTGTLVAVKIIRNKKRFHQQALVEVNILQKLKEWVCRDGTF